MQAANSEAKGAQRHAVLAANFEEHALAAPSKVLDALCRAARRKADGRQGFQGQRRASGACGVG